MADGVCVAVVAVPDPTALVGVVVGGARAHVIDACYATEEKTLAVTYTLEGQRQRRRRPTTVKVHCKVAGANPEDDGMVTEVTMPVEPTLIGTMMGAWEFMGGYGDVVGLACAAAVMRSTVCFAEPDGRLTLVPIGAAASPAIPATHTLMMHAPVEDCAASPFASCLVALSGVRHLLEITVDGTCSRYVSTAAAAGYPTAVACDGVRIVFGVSCSSDVVPRLHVLDYVTQEPLASFCRYGVMPGSMSVVTAVRLHADGIHVLACEGDAEQCPWMSLFTLTGQWVRAIATGFHLTRHVVWLDGGRVVAATDAEDCRQVHKFSVRTGKLIDTVTLCESGVGVMITHGATIHAQALTCPTIVAMFA